MLDNHCISQIKNLTSGYVRKGSKENRKRQVKKMIAVVSWIESQDKLGDINRMGSRQIVGFWQAHENLSDKTRYEYWRALCVLFELLKRTDMPPVPYSFKENQFEFPSGIQTLLDKISDTRLSRRVSTKNLAKQSGCRESTILDLDRHPGKITLHDLDRILHVLELTVEVKTFSSLDREMLTIDVGSG